MNEQERQAVTDQLTAGHQRIVGLVDGLTPEQWTFRPGEARWSINECVEHVMNVENRIVGLIGQKVSEPPDSGHDSPRRNDEEIAKVVVDRTNRRQAPEAVRPTGKWQDGKDLLDEFQNTRSRSRQLIARSDGDLRNYFIPHQFFGQLDCYQWLLLLGAHAERHAKQIEEIKADSSFPRR